MKRLNSKGFTLVELIVTIILLSLIMTIGGTAVIRIIKNMEERDYELLINEIKGAVENYYIECRYSDDVDSCQSQLVLGDLVSNGFLAGNAKDDNDNSILINNKDDFKRSISDCSIEYEYENGKIKIIEPVEQNDAGVCPTICDYEPDTPSCIEE